jgi:hypothetical protein
MSSQQQSWGSERKLVANKVHMLAVYDAPDIIVIVQAWGYAAAMQACQAV